MIVNLKPKTQNLKPIAGQSLIEIIIALAIGALLIGAASTAVVIVLQSSTTGQRQQSTTVLAQDIIERTRSYAEASWGNIYDLSKGSSTTYYFNTTSTQLFVIEGEEGVIDNDIRSGLVGYWKFDEASSTAAYDYSGNGNDGVLMGGVTRATSTCKVSYCLEFDNDYVDAAGGIYSSNGITVSAWVYLTGNQYCHNVVGTLGSPNRFIMPMYPNNGWVYFYLTGDDSIARSTKTTTCPTNRWLHIVETYDGSYMKIYFDGVEQTEATKAVSFNYTSINFSTLKIGERGDISGSPFDGLIDEVRIYNQALSADEVEHLYNSTLFTRYFYVENVSRDSDGNIKSGETDDPSTQKVTVIMEWEAAQGSSQFALSEYIMRWKNRIFRQTDWSGGSGQEGPITVPSNKYASSTDIDISSIGTFRIEGL